MLVHTTGVHNFVLLSLLKVVLKKKECFFRCYKLCGETQAWDWCINSSDTMWICVRLESM